MKKQRDSSAYRSLSKDENAMFIESLVTFTGMLTNYHSHCNFCDGAEDAEKYVVEAIKQGFDSYGFSSHIPLKDFDTTWNMKRERLEEYIRLITDLKQKYNNQIALFCAFETDFKLSIHQRKELMQKFPEVDYTVGSIHYVGHFENGRPWEIDGTKEVFEKGLSEIFGGDIKKVVNTYFDLTAEMIETEQPDILGHADKIKMHHLFDESEPWFTKRMHEIIELAKEKETILEINTRGLYKGYTADFYPASNWVKEAHKKGVRLQVNSDAHQLHELSAGFDKAVVLLKEIGVKEVWARKGNSWEPVPVV